MANNYQDKLWTYTLTSANGDSNSGSVTIDGDTGVKMIAIQGTSVTETTVIGGAVINSLPSIALTTSSAKSSITICATPGSVIHNLVITCPSGATADILANI